MYSQATKGNRLTLLCAISIEGIESFIIVQGSVKGPLWAYFIREATELYLRKHKELNANDLLVLFDNVNIFPL